MKIEYRLIGLERLQKIYHVDIGNMSIEEAYAIILDRMK